MPDGFDSAPPSQSSKTPISDMSAAEREALGTELQASFKAALTTLSTAGKESEIDDFVNKVLGNYSEENRAFHRPQHVLQILPEDLQEKIRNPQKLTPNDCKELVFAAYHDAEYHIDSSKNGAGEQKPFAVKTFKEHFGGAESASAKDIFAKIPGISDDDKKALQGIFGFDGDNENKQIKFVGAPLNELLSACSFVHDARALGMDNDTILEGMVRIQMTVPFQPDHALHLFEAAQKQTQFPAKKLLSIVNDAVEMSNRDIGNLVGNQAWKMLEGDRLMFVESGGDISDHAKLQKSYESTGFMGFLAGLNAKDSLAQPTLKIGEDGKVTADKDSAYYTTLKANTASNLEVIGLANQVMAAVLSDMNTGQDTAKTRIAELIPPDKKEGAVKLMEAFGKYTEHCPKTPYIEKSASLVAERLQSLGVDVSKGKEAAAEVSKPHPKPFELPGPRVLQPEKSRHNVENKGSGRSSAAERIASERGDGALSARPAWKPSGPVSHGVLGR